MTRWLGLAALAALLALPEITMSQDSTPANPNQEDWAAVDLEALTSDDDARWIEFLDVPTLSAGVYRLPRGGEDGQSPHELDEVYSVVSGRATLVVGEGERAQRLEAKPGSVLFVRAGVAHRFVEIEEDLVVVVVFAKAAPAAER